MNKSTILVVEDNEDHVFLLKHAFQKAEIANPLQVAITGEDAIAYLEGTGKYSDWQQFPLPAIVLLDLKLPGLSGFDVLKWIRQHPGLKALRVAMLTSSDLDHEIKMAYEMGANAFLTKPVELGRLVDMVKILRVHWLEFTQAPAISRTRQPIAANERGSHPLMVDGENPITPVLIGSRSLTGQPSPQSWRSHFPPAGCSQK